MDGEGPAAKGPVPKVEGLLEVHGVHGDRGNAGHPGVHGAGEPGGPPALAGSKDGELFRVAALGAALVALVDELLRGVHRLDRGLDHREPRGPQVCLRIALPLQIHVVPPSVRDEGVLAPAGVLRVRWEDARLVGHLKEGHSDRLGAHGEVRGEGNVLVHRVDLLRGHVVVARDVELGCREIRELVGRG